MLPGRQPHVFEAMCQEAGKEEKENDVKSLLCKAVFSKLGYADASFVFLRAHNYLVRLWKTARSASASDNCLHYFPLTDNDGDDMLSYMINGISQFFVIDTPSWSILLEKLLDGKYLLSGFYSIRKCMQMPSAVEELLINADLEC